MSGTERRRWRKALKKQQRKRRRRKIAKERDRLEAEAAAAKLKDPAYCEQEAKLREDELHRREVDEAAWRQSEKWQDHLCALARKRHEAEEHERLKREDEQQRLDAEQKRQQAEAAKLFDTTMDRMQDFLEDASGNAATPLPAELRSCVYSRPNAKLCQFFERTNCCRFDAQCIFNHRRPLLSCVVIVRHFFSHPLLADLNVKSNDYRSECNLYTEYEAFFEDVVTEFERYGKIINFGTTRNVQLHLRGHVFVEYTEEKSALNAFIKLQGRYYDGSRLNVEFSNLQQWWRAICGT